MTKNDYQRFYDSITRRVTTSLANNPALYFELEQSIASIHSFHPDKNYFLENDYHTIVLSDYQSDNKSIDHPLSRILIMELTSYGGELVIEQSEIIVMFGGIDLPPLVKLSYSQNVFSNKGIEVERSGLTTSFNDPAFLINSSSFHSMHNVLKRYYPRFNYDALPECPIPTDYQTTSTYLYKRHPNNLSTVKTLSNICKQDLERMFSVRNASAIEEATIQEKKDTLMHQSGAKETTAGSLLIEAVHPITGPYPHRLDFADTISLTSDDNYRAKYFLDKVEASPLSKLDTTFHNQLIELGKQQLKQEEAQLKR